MTSTRNRPRALTIVGPGKIGRSFFGAATAAGLEASLVTRDQLTVGPSEFHFEPGRVTLLAVPDSEIAAACGSLLRSGLPRGPVGHLSGATGLSALKEATEVDVAVFSMHPLQTFADGETDPSGVHCAVTASDPFTHRQVEDLARAIGMLPFKLAEADRGAYHAAAAMASNFLVTLEADAAGLLGKLGLTDSREMLAPLISRSLDNWIKGGAGALTGPIVRGDEQTVSRHVEALQERAPELVDCYLALAARTRAVAATPAGKEAEALA